jgi:hypothetical protein
MQELYAQLQKQVQRKTLTRSMRTKLCTFLSSKELPHQARIHAAELILLHAEKNEFIGVVPYGGKQTSEGVRFNLLELPSALQILLYEFMLLTQTHHDTDRIQVEQAYANRTDMQLVEQKTDQLSISQKN